MRAIDADEVIKRINDIEITPTTNLFELSGRLIGIINTAPTIKAVKHGKWKAYSEFDRRDRVIGYMIVCSVCNASYFKNYLDNNLFDYCPYCGAKMERGWNE